MSQIVDKYPPSVEEFSKNSYVRIQLQTVLGVIKLLVIKLLIQLLV